MDKSIELLIALGRFLRAISAFVIWAYGQWIVFAAVLERVPFYQAMAWGALGAAGIGFALWALLLLLDRFIAHRDGTREAREAALRFDELRVAGERELALLDAAQLWLGTPQREDRVYQSTLLVRLRQLKFAVKQGLLPCEAWFSEKPDEFPGREVRCRTEAYAAFIRERRWRSLRDEPLWPDPQQRKAAVQRAPGPKENWVTGWRR